MPPLLRGRLDESLGLTPAAYDEARRIASQARSALAGILTEVDVLLTFSAPGAAPRGLASTGDPRFNRLWTLMGVPCVNVPVHVTEDGLPVGVQVIARFGAEGGGLGVARLVEEARGGVGDDNVIRGRAAACPGMRVTPFRLPDPSLGPRLQSLMLSRCM